MRIKTAEQYLARYDRRGAAMAPRTRFSDQPKPSAVHYLAVVWGGVPGECGAECACGVTFDGFGRIGEATEHIDRHILRVAGGKPDHAARAASIDACFPPLAARDGGRAYHPGKETVTVPLTEARRLTRYLHQNHGRPLTPAQLRRNAKKSRAASA